MRIGFDLDNTIFDYSKALEQLVREDLRFPGTQILKKEHVKTYLIQNFDEDSWTEFQGKLYTSCFDNVSVSPNTIELLNDLSRYNEVHILSHKTRFPALGPQIDMRIGSMQKLEELGLKVRFGSEKSGIKVRFFDTSAEKIHVINSMNLDFFLDDLQSILVKVTTTQTRALFTSDPTDHDLPFRVFQNWSDIDTYLRKIYLDL
jgi:hypothetical protein